MKLIMENFRKNMQEGWPGSEKSQDSSWSWGGNKEDAEAFVQKQLAKTRKSRQDAEDAIDAEKKQLIDNPRTPDEKAMGGAILRLEMNWSDLVEPCMRCLMMTKKLQFKTILPIVTRKKPSQRPNILKK